MYYLKLNDVAVFAVVHEFSCHYIRSIPPPPEYDTGRFLPETAALDPNILSDGTEFIAVFLLDGKMLTLSNVCVGPRVIAVGCSIFSYCKTK